MPLVVLKGASQDSGFMEEFIMASKDTELEVKFFMADLPALQAELEKLEAGCVQERVHEVNLRFDTPDEQLSKTFRVLRLRKDRNIRLTYKGPGRVQDGVRLREELEFTAGDFDTAKAFLEALGYQVVVMYEKYRTTYAMGEVLVTLDEMPYGNFAEIEGPDGTSIQEAASRLGLNWDRRILDSYLVLFDQVRVAMGFTFHDLSFANFENLAVPPDALGVQQADV
jgi:adenylate cyclase, class 2